MEEEEDDFYLLGSSEKNCRDFGENNLEDLDGFDFQRLCQGHGHLTPLNQEDSEESEDGSIQDCENEYQEQEQQDLFLPFEEEEHEDCDFRGDQFQDMHYNSIGFGEEIHNESADDRSSIAEQNHLPPNQPLPEEGDMPPTSEESTNFMGVTNIYSLRNNETSDSFPNFSTPTSSRNQNPNDFDWMNDSKSVGNENCLFMSLSNGISLYRNSIESIKKEWFSEEEKWQKLMELISKIDNHVILLSQRDEFWNFFVSRIWGDRYYYEKIPKNGIDFLNSYILQWIFSVKNNNITQQQQRLVTPNFEVFNFQVKKFIEKKKRKRGKKKRRSNNKKLQKKKTVKHRSIDIPHEFTRNYIKADKKGIIKKWGNPKKFIRLYGDFTVDLTDILLENAAQEKIFPNDSCILVENLQKLNTTMNELKGKERGHVWGCILSFYEETDANMNMFSDLCFSYFKKYQNSVQCSLFVDGLGDRKCFLEHILKNKLYIGLFLRANHIELDDEKVKVEEICIEIKRRLENL